MDVFIPIKKIGLLLAFTIGCYWSANSQITLEESIAQARENAPAYALIPIVKAENDLKLKNIGTSFRPQVSLLAQATYQSEVTSLDIPIPNFEFESLSKDQYKIQAEISQNLYDGGLTRQRKILQNTSAEMEVLGVELQLEKVRTQVISIYFAILEVDAQTQLLAYKKEDLLARQKVILAAVENGTLLKMESQSLEAALLVLDQQLAQLKALRKTQLKTLSLLSTMDLQENTSLEIPTLLTNDFTPNSQSNKHRLLSLGQISLDQKSDLDQAINRPKAGLFLRAGYGKPGLNFLKNEFTPYYIAGARLQWNLNGLYTRSADLKIRNLSKEKISIQKDNYDLQVNTKAEQYRIEIVRLQSLLESDKEIVSLRQKIKNTASVQVDNGVMTSADYLQHLNEENEARQNKSLHQIQLIKNQYLLQDLTGN